jgi:biopolymer transport protein ExbB
MALGMDTKLTAQVVAGHKINLGGIYKAFTSTESEDVAILSKTGRVDDQAWDWVESVLPEKREALNTWAKQITNSDTSKAMLVPIDVQLKRAVGEGYSSARISTFWKDIIDELKGAGFVIYGMGLLAFLSIWIMADKIRIFSYRGREGKKFSKEIFALIDDNRIDDAIHFAKLHHGSVPFIFRAVLKGIKKNKGRDEIENIAFERILHETPIIEKGIGTINIFAAAAPLLGLLGTVSGMVNLFAAITLHGTSDPKIMAAGIAEALLSTKWGLIVAIPLLLIYNWTKNQSEKIISNMEKYTAKLINHLYGTSHGLDLESKKKKKKEKKKKKKEKENNPEEDIEAISTNA